MKFIVQWSGKPDVRQPAAERLLSTGVLPPDNVRILGRWHAIGEFSGVAIAETTDASALVKLVHPWTDLFSFTISPALSDEELGATLAAFQAESK
jgi:hypothetical protein